ncbi:BTB/POZ protein [Dioszegia hungarica]|uniref:Elongin-C n=1 Tax=Dioszegia hungarica TaxID=4972 RepID=A0AA38LYV9_9TREE|nr:BTB/POZ protein [Dioszegia hungarica]KAI9639646.1 BTB/POZ protein [Dioszegia hungarica]
MSGDFVKLVSADGYTFVVPRNVALQSGTLRSMLDPTGNFTEAETNTCHIQYRGVIVLKVIEYLAYKLQYLDTSSDEIVEDFSDRVDPYIALELLTASDFLEV